jgi:Zinc-ribbon, C4HC2 type
MQGSEFDPVDSTGAPAIFARRACHSCRRRVGMCFLCHEPVTGVFVWCPGCGHGGHLDHALEWFGGSIGSPVREVCPTGCGHKCNLKRQLNSFPRTESFYKCMEVGGGD